MRVLVACEFSGVVRDAFLARGHDAWSCDLLPTASFEHSHRHIQGDVLKVLANRRRYGKWDLMIAHPPCTYLCNSGVRWLYHQGTTRIEAQRWADMEAGAAFFRALYDAKVPRVAVENPVMHGHAKEKVGVEFTQSIQPWQFGHGETKRTCLWLRGLPPLRPTNIVSGRAPVVHFTSPGPDRGLLRSITYRGIADAMADQWGSL